jgi:CubicO group peptidase (beta-lactamase class C family)
MSRPPSAAFAALAASAETLRRKMAIPGAAIGILAGNRRFIRGLGVTSIIEPRPVTASTLFQIGSITKTLSATLALRLCDQGRLALDRPVKAWLPELRLKDSSVARRLTLRHLLTHTGGWAGDYFDDTGRGNDALRLMSSRLRQLPQQTPLGATWSYNNAGFYLVGRLIEAVTGDSYEHAVRTRLFSPLGMEESIFIPEDAMTRSFAVGHNVSGRAAAVAHPWAMPRSAHPAGGACTGVDDLLRFAASQLRGGYLRSATRQTAMTPQAPAGCGIESMGLGWMMLSSGGTTRVWHGGATNGQVSSLTLVPSRGFALAVLTNANTGGAFAAEVTRRGLRAFLGAQDEPKREVRLPRGDLRGYSGRFESQLWARVLRLTRDGLMMRTITKGGFPTQDAPPLPPPPPARLAFYERDRFFMEGAQGPLTEGEFLRDSRGRIAWLRVAARLHAPS